ncbi:MAG TPA: FkbM family methyltransferase [Actinomycetota bacterium]|nr:FkbM family methyltransferase [Actinomycetota bacterium]
MDLPLPSSRAAAIAPLLDDPIVVVDVGARWGFASTWDDLGDRYVAIGFEPDAEECRRLQELHRRSGAPHRVAPVALGPRSGVATLHVTRQPACSSLYPPSAAAYERHPGLGVITPESSVMVELAVLDEWCAAEGIARVDVIKVDTQGSELGVLEGAQATLAGVRAVEVEVEFNELYAGAPLFGDVDRFLRRRGFVLWRLRDLAHYGQAGADLGWRTPDVWQLDDGAHRFDSGPGQLFWANAYYLRREVAYPAAGLGWHQLVRDACITGALGFHDVSGLALGLARDGAPPAVAERISAALASPGAPPAPAAPAPVSSFRRPGTVKISLTDPAFAGGGWHPPQVVGDLGLRWSGPGRDAWIDLPAVVGAGSRVELLVAAAVTPEVEGSLAVSVGGRNVALTASPHRHGTLYAGVVPEGALSRRGSTRVMVGTSATRLWSSVNPSPGSPASASEDGDLELGVAVAWVRVTLAGEGPS